MSLRLIPNLNVYRPADYYETIYCYKKSLTTKMTPSAFILSRQALPTLNNKDFKNIQNGAYIIKKEDEKSDIDLILMATGSEVSLAFKVRDKLKQQNINSKVVSILSFEIFDKQDKKYKKLVLGNDKILKVGIEAGIRMGWERYLDKKDIFIGMNSFGASGKAEDLFKHFGFCEDEITKKIISIANLTK